MEMRNEFPYRRQRADFFFPILMITAGVIWLLVNNGIVPVENVYRLVPFWPVVLILAGLSLMVRRLWWPLSGLIWLAAGAGVVLLVLNPVGLPSRSVANLRHETFQEPLDSAKSADVNLNFSVYPVRVEPLATSSLIEADLYSANPAEFRVSGSDPKTVRLGGNNFVTGWDWLVPGNPPAWKIGLSPSIPLRLTVDGGISRSTMDLSGLRLESLTIDSGVGSVQADLPASDTRFPVQVDVGTGSVTLRVPANSGAEINASGGTGNLTIEIPQGAGVQIEVTDGGLGNLRLPPGYKRVRAGDDQREGTWENDAFATTQTPIRIRLDLGVGNVTIR